MAELITKIGIKDSTGTSYDTRDIGAKGQNISIGYDADNNVLSNVDELPEDVTVFTTKTLTDSLIETNTNINTLNQEKAPTNHAWESDEADYGKADESHYGHIKLGTGLYYDNDAASSTYGLTNVAFAAEGESDATKAICSSDSRLSDNRKNPEAITFMQDESTSVTYDGSSSLQVTYETVGAAPSGHPSILADKNTNGHVKIGTGIAVSNGVIFADFDTTATAGKVCQANDARLSDARTPLAHASTSTSYGGATATNYGHVKLADNPTITFAADASKSSYSAAKSIGASLYAAQVAYQRGNTACNFNFTQFKTSTYSYLDTNGEAKPTLKITFSASVRMLIVGTRGAEAMAGICSGGTGTCYYNSIKNTDSDTMVVTSGKTGYITIKNTTATNLYLYYHLITGSASSMTLTIS